MTESEIFPHLQIINPELFESAQEILQQRSSKYKERKIPLNTKGNSLLAGNIFCGHCGSRLTLTTNGKKYFRKDGEVTITPKTRYVCYNKTRHKSQCDGQTGYTMSKLDNIVDQIVRRFFANLKDFPKDQVILEQYNKKMAVLENSLKQTFSEHKSFVAEMKEYETEVLKIIRGESKLDSALLNKLYSEAKEKVEESSKIIARIEAEKSNSKKILDTFNKQYEKLTTWESLYDISDIAAKKMIIAQIISAVKVHAGYEIEIDMNITFEQFGFDMHIGEEQHERATVKTKNPARITA